MSITILFFISSFWICTWVCAHDVVEKSDVLDSKPRLVFRIPSELTTLDWNRATDSADSIILNLLMEGLVRKIPGNSRYEPALGESWEYLSKTRTLIFKLNSNILWSDGVPLKAKDFVFSWRRLLSPLTGSPLAKNLFFIEGAGEFYEGTQTDFSKVGIKEKDSSEIHLKLNSFDSEKVGFFSKWYTFPLREDLVSQVTSGWEIPGRILTLGPYLLVSHDLDRNYILKANPRYYRKEGFNPQPNAVDLEVQILVDDFQAMENFKDKKFDLAFHIPSSLSNQREKAQSDVVFDSCGSVMFLGFQKSGFPFALPDIGRAIVLSLDRQQLFNHLQIREPLRSLSKIGEKFDPSLAKALIKKVSLNPERLNRLELAYVEGQPRKKTAQWIQSQLKTHLGVSIELKEFTMRNFRSQRGLGALPFFLEQWKVESIQGLPDEKNLSQITAAQQNVLNTFLLYFESLVTLKRSDLKAQKYFESLEHCTE